MTRHTMLVLGALSAAAIAGPAGAQSSSASADAQARLEAVRSRGAQVSAEATKKVEAKLAAEASKVDVQSEQKGEAAVAARLAKEFHVSADALTEERARFDAGWGELMIAHTLDANAKTDLTMDQILSLRQEGMGWGQIAGGLGLSPGGAVSAVQAETRVASGLDRPDGRVAPISAGVTSASSTHATAGSTGAGVTTGLGIGLGGR
jgi:hypothetical protein